MGLGSNARSKYRNFESHGPWDSNPWDAWDLDKYRWDIPETKISGTTEFQALGQLGTLDPWDLCGFLGTCFPWPMRF